MKHILIIRPGEEFTVFSCRTEERVSFKTISVVGPDITIEIDAESDHLVMSSGIRRGVSL